MTKHLRIALIGRGQWGKNIEKTLRTLPQCTLAYIEEKDYHTLISKKDIDAVIVATPGSTHTRVALPFIKRGLPVFIEKPMATSVAEAEKLRKAAQKSGSQIFAGHLHKYNPAYRVMKRAAKKIGRIRFIVGEGSNNGPYRDDMSAAWDWAPHDIYMMLDLLSEIPRSVEAWGASLLRPETKLYDVVYIKLNFPSGKIGFIFNTWLSPEKRKKLVIVGEKSSIVFDDTASQKVALYENMGPEVTKKSVTRKEPRVLYPKYDNTPSLTLELKAFLEMVQSDKKPKTDINEGLAVVKILDAVERSITSGKQIQMR